MSIQETTGEGGSGRGGRRSIDCCHFEQPVLGAVTRGAEAALDGQDEIATGSFAFCQTASSSSASASAPRHPIANAGRAVAARLGRFIGHFHEVAFVSGRISSAHVISAAGRNDDDDDERIGGDDDDQQENGQDEPSE